MPAPSNSEPSYLQFVEEYMMLIDVIYIYNYIYIYLYKYNIKGPELVGMLQLCFISIPRNDI